MPDITLCVSHKCPKAKQCYRHEATPNPNYQSYFAGIWGKKSGKCRNFLDMGDPIEPKPDNRQK